LNFFERQTYQSRFFKIVRLSVYIWWFSLPLTHQPSLSFPNIPFAPFFRFFQFFTLFHPFFRFFRKFFQKTFEENKRNSL